MIPASRFGWRFRTLCKRKRPPNIGTQTSKIPLLCANIRNFNDLMQNSTVAQTKCSAADSDATAQPLHINKALLLKKMSRYEYEKSLAPGVDDFELERILASRGSDFRSLINRHDVHLTNVDRISETLRSRGISCSIVEMGDYESEAIDDADVVLTAGGDGIFLLAANKVLCRSKPVIGINTDPTRSEGHLCLPKRYTNALEKALDQLLSGKFRWVMRRRIRLAMSKKKDDPLPTPVLLKDQKPPHPEHRFTEHFQEISDSKLNPDTWSTPVSRMILSSDIATAEDWVVLPCRALNDVFVGESVSARVSYFEMGINSKPRLKHKCSGLVVATGTGSGSWYLNIHKLSPDNVGDIIEILRRESPGAFAATEDKRLFQRIAETYNRSLVFDPTEKKMAYIIRDPIVNRVFSSQYPEHGFVETLSVRSRMFDACLVIDGGISYPFNDGSRVVLSMHDEDSLRTVQLID